ncbi:MAG: alkaline phosphatase family protein [Haloarculaceae archaeon]
MTASDRGPRVVALAVDGMEPSLLERWIDAGELPNLRALREAGAYGTAHCSSLSSANQWTTHFTGVTPEYHGVAGFLKGDRKRQAGEPAPEARELINLSDIRVKTYPELVAEAGIGVGLLNPLPLWPPLELEGGFCVSGMLTPPTTDRWVHPPGLESELEELGYRIDVRYGDRPYGFVDDDLFGEVSLETLREDMFDVLDARIRFTERAVTEHDVDYFYVLLKSIDVIQHCFWAHMTGNDPTYGDVILESYRRVDDLVGWLREETDANLLVFSDHGFGPRMSEPPEGLHRLATGIASRIPFGVPMPLRRAYDSVTRSPVDTGVDGISVNSTTGTHSNPAVWALVGPDVDTAGPREIRFEDLPPTILALLDEPVPEAYVGSAIDAVPTPRVEERSLAVRRETHIGDYEVISERLHNLGYAEMVDED